MHNSHSSKSNLLREVENKGEFTLKELVRWTNRLLPVFVPKQKRYKVSELVNERIIRYYLNEGLINKPNAYKGRYAVFSSSHVFQILVVKYLQSSYIPLKKIFDIRQVFKKHDLKRILLDEKTGDILVSGIVGRTERDTHDLVERKKIATFPLDRSNRAWKNFKIHDHVELKVKREFDIRDQDADMGKIISKILLALSSVGQENYNDEDSLYQDTGLDSLNLGYMSPAIPLESRQRTIIALITEGGLVPKGNPDKLEPARAKRFLRYDIQGINDLQFGEFESIDRGWDNVHVNDDPNRLLPLDIMREFEREKEIFKLHRYFYTTTGAGTSIDSAKSMGKKIARELKAKGVSSVLMTST